MQQQHNLEEDPCFFCKEKNLQSCITRSLFHKHNRGVEKFFQIVTQLVNPSKQKAVLTQKQSQLRNRYEEMKHLIDRKENMQNFLLFFSARLQLMDLLEYYKYRKYVPIFCGSADNSCIAESMHSYYYDRLKLYYNEIKKKFNMTIESTFQQELESSFNSKSEQSEKLEVDNKSKILIEIPCKNSIEMIKNMESESKALNNLMKYLKKQQIYIKKIKKSKIENNPNEKQQQTELRTGIQKRNNLAKYLIQENKLMIKKNNNKDFFRFISLSNDNKIIKSIHGFKIKKKSIIEQFTKTIYNQKEKNRRKSQSLSKLKKQLSNNKLNLLEKQKLLINQKKKINIIHKSQKCFINCTSIPLKKFIISKKQNKKQNLLVPFNCRENRSQSSTSKLNNANTINGQQRCKLNLKYLINQKQIDCMKQYHTSRAEPKQTLEQQRKKLNHTKTPIKNQLEIDAHDNLPSINRKKLEELKLKSQRKKQGRK